MMQSSDYAGDINGEVSEAIETAREGYYEVLMDQEDQERQV